MNVFKIILISLFSCGVLKAQTDEGEKALNQVLEILTSKADQNHLVDEKDLEKGAWEALSYLNEKSGEYSTEDLLEAVPDYYSYKNGQLILKLINPQNYNEYGLELTVKYQLSGDTVQLFGENGELKDSWLVLYLDENYLALDMGDLHVFFTHSPIQE
jgi:hypothetical protein